MDKLKKCYAKIFKKCLTPVKTETKPKKKTNAKKKAVTKKSR